MEFIMRGSSSPKIDLSDGVASSSKKHQIDKLQGLRPRHGKHDFDTEDDSDSEEPAPCSLSMLEALETCKDRHYEDPRDYVWDVLRLVHVDQRILIDHAKSAFGVFRQALAVVASRLELGEDLPVKAMIMNTTLADKMGIPRHTAIDILQECYEQAQEDLALRFSLTTDDDMHALDESTSELSIGESHTERMVKGVELLPQRLDEDDRTEYTGTPVISGTEDLNGRVAFVLEIDTEVSRMATSSSGLEVDTNGSIDGQQSTETNSSPQEFTPDPSSSEHEGSDSPSYGETKTETIDYLMETFYAHLYSLLRQAHGGNHHTSGATQNGLTGDSESSTGIKPGSSRKSGKRKATDAGDADDKEEDEDENCLQKRPKRRNKSRRLACPFFKHDPRKYSEESSCTGPGFLSTHRMKEHIYKNHTRPIHCIRCKRIFESEELVTSHLLATTSCEIVTGVLFDGISKSQVERLKSRRRVDLGDGTEEVKWRRTYMIIFPDTLPSEIPSPYYSLSELDDFETYLLQEMPSRFQTQVEHRYDALVADATQEVRAQIPIMIRDLIRVMIQEYRTRQNSTERQSIGQQHVMPSSQRHPSPNSMQVQPDALTRIDENLRTVLQDHEPTLGTDSHGAGLFEGYEFGNIDDWDMPFLDEEPDNGDGWADITGPQ